MENNRYHNVSHVKLCSNITNSYTKNKKQEARYTYDLMFTKWFTIKNSNDRTNYPHRLSPLHYIILTFLHQ